MFHNLLAASFLIYSAVNSQNELACYAILDSLTKEIVYKTPSFSPEPVSGMAALHKALRKKVLVETTVNIEGAPYELSIVAFVVCSDGKIIGERIVKRSLLPKMEEQILEVIKSLEWKPGICENQKVHTLIEFPMRIRIEE